MLRPGAPWHDLPEPFGPYTTAYNPFNRRSKAGIWERLIDAVVKAQDGNAADDRQFDRRVHQHVSGGERVEIVAWAEAEAASPP
ncbi:transposase [Bradyrhizobium sp. IC3069]|nr:transposase [Bradyrhizobium sp. IC4059]MCA1518424.1 transposase [Bradyrhizobium sp. IC3069]